MFFDWKVTSKYEIVPPPKELYEAILSRLAASRLEVRTTEFSANSFKIVAALKSKGAYMLSYKGKESNFSSPFSEISCVDNTIIIETINPIVVSMMLIFAIYIAFRCGYVMIQHGEWVALLFPAFIVVAFWCFACYFAKKCHKEATRCVIESISPTEEK